MKNKLGYVTLETVIIMGLMIGLGAYSILQFANTSYNVMDGQFDSIRSSFLV